MEQGMNILHQIPTETKIKMELKKVLFNNKKYENCYRCLRCRKPFSFTSITWLKGMKLPLRTFWLLLWAWTNKTPINTDGYSIYRALASGGQLITNTNVTTVGNSPFRIFYFLVLNFLFYPSYQFPKFLFVSYKPLCTVRLKKISRCREELLINMFFQKLQKVYL